MGAIVITDRIEQARELLASCRTIEDWKIGADKAAAVAELCKRYDAASAAHADAWALKEIAERGLGELIRELPKAVQGRPRAGVTETEAKDFSRGEKSKGVALKDLGINHTRAAALEQKYDIPTEEFVSRLEAGRAVILKTGKPTNILRHTAGSEYDSDHYGSPELVLDCSRELLGGEFDLDPCSNPDSQKLVRAKRFWTKEDDCLQQKTWKAMRLWMNPPFSRVITEIMAKLVEQVEAGNVKAGVVLVNNQTDTDWFHSMLDRFPVWLSKGRLHFVVQGIELKNTRQGQAAFYIGPNAKLKMFKGLFETKLGGKVLVAA